MKLTGILSGLLLVFITACHKNSVQNQFVAATINGKPINYSQIDQLAKHELYDELSRIYWIRKNALDETIDNKLLENEAKKAGKNFTTIKDEEVMAVITTAP